MVKAAGVEGAAHILVSVNLTAASVEAADQVAAGKYPVYALTVWLDGKVRHFTLAEIQALVREGRGGDHQDD